MSKMKNKSYEVNIFEDRFLELFTNSQMRKFDEKSIFEIEKGLELEAKCTIQIIQKLILILWLRALTREKVFLLIIKE